MKTLKVIGIILGALFLYALLVIQGQALDTQPKTKEQMIAEGYSEYSFIILTPEEYELLAQCVYAESANQSLEGQIAVTQVILNRYLCPRFKADNHLENIICNHSQFTTYPGFTYCEPNEQTYQAVEMTLLGQNLQLPYDVYFFSQGLNRGTTYYCKIGDHVFAK